MRDEIVLPMRRRTAALLCQGEITKVPKSMSSLMIVLSVINITRLSVHGENLAMQNKFNTNDIAVSRGHVVLAAVLTLKIFVSLR